MAMQANYEILTSPERRKLSKFIGKKGNLKAFERTTDLNVNTIKRAAAGMRVTQFSLEQIRKHIN